MRALLAAAAAGAVAASAPGFVVPSITLGNTALPGLTMPAIGLGTGGYGQTAAGGWGSYPECWIDAAGCGPWVQNATESWLRMGWAGGLRSIRIDNSNTYGDVGSIGAAMKASGVPRASTFLLSKVGSGDAMGYNETLSQFAAILATQGVSYVDALLIHWPTSPANSSDPACNHSSPSTYDATACRLSTWRAMLDIFNSGGALSVGVSNYNVSQLEEIAAAGLPLPAINQIPIHPYRSSSQMRTIAYCARNGIAVMAYSPLGAPDFHSYPTAGTGMAASPLVDPVVQSIAAARGVTPAQVIINWLWQLGIVTNPRTVQPAHMAENFGAYAFDLTDAEVNALSSRPQDWCSADPTWYECAAVDA